MVQLEQGHVIIMAVLLVIRVKEEVDHLEGHLCVAGGILKIFAQVNSPDGGRGQPAGHSREDSSSHGWMGEAACFCYSLLRSLVWIIISLRGAFSFHWLLILRIWVGHLFDALTASYRSRG